MKNDDLLNLIGRVDDKYITELYDDMAADEQRAAESAPKKKGVWKKWTALAACFAVVLVGGIALFESQSGDAAPVTQPPVVNEVHQSIVILDVNPSIQLMVNSDGDVKSVTPLNDDAKALLEGQELGGLDCSACVEEIFDDLTEGEYLTQAKNSVLVSVVGEQNEESESMRAMMVDAVDAAADKSQLEVSVLSQVVSGADNYAAESEKYGISVGKAALIENIASGAEDYDYAELAGLNIHALNQIMEYIGSSAAQRTGNVAGAISEEVSGDLNIAKMAVGDALDLAVSMSDVYDRLCELNPEIDTSTYTGYDFRLEQGVDADGSKTWTIVAENAKDSSQPSVSVKLDKNLIPDNLRNAGKAIFNDTVKLACDIFGMVKNSLPIHN